MGMGNIAHIQHLDPRRVARAQFVKSAIADDHRSQRYVAGSIGLPASSLTDRLVGRVAFTAEDIEGIARVLKRDPVEFYRDYINAPNNPPSDYLVAGPRPVAYLSSYRAS